MEYIPFASPSIEIGRVTEGYIKKVLISGQFCLGPHTMKLEDYFRTRFDIKYAIACSSATQGLLIALQACKIKNMHVALPVFTWPSTLYAIECSNNTPIFCDIDKDTWSFRNKIRPGEYAEVFVPVDIFGSKTVYNTNIPTVYDAAHGFGLDGLGHRGLAEVVSLSFTKPITAGQGGMILTNDKYIYDEAKELVKLSAKILEISAIIFFKSLFDYEERLEDRKRIIDKYRKLIKVPFTEQVVQQETNYSTYSILFNDHYTRENVVAEFIENNIEPKIYYKPVRRGFPIAEDIYSRIISLPTYRQMEDKVPFIANLINGG